MHYVKLVFQCCKTLWNDGNFRSHKIHDQCYRYSLCCPVDIVYQPAGDSLHTINVVREENAQRQAKLHFQLAAAAASKALQAAAVSMHLSARLPVVRTLCSR